MAPITWRNIDAPNLNGGAYGLQLAGQSFDRAADGVNLLFEEQQRIDNANWDNQARINTQDAVARLKGLANLQDLNAQEGSFDPTALRSTMGQQFDAATILRALAEQRAKLTGEAVVAAGTTGLNTADSTHSAAEAVDAYRNSLIQSGVKDPNVINSKVQEFMQSGLAAKKEGWTEQEDQQIAQGRAMLQGMGLNNPIGSTNPAPAGASTAYNVGNIRDVNNPGQFLKFNSKEEGIAAIDHQLGLYGSKHGVDTLGGVISRWSPPNENDTPALIARAAKLTGLDPNAKIDLSNPDVRQPIIQAILRQEGKLDANGNVKADGITALSTGGGVTNLNAVVANLGATGKVSPRVFNELQKEEDTLRRNRTNDIATASQQNLLDETLRKQVTERVALERANTALNQFQDPKNPNAGDIEATAITIPNDEYGNAARTKFREMAKGTLEKSQATQDNERYQDANVLAAIKTISDKHDAVINGITNNMNFAAPSKELQQHAIDAEAHVNGIGGYVKDMLKGNGYTFFGRQGEAGNAVIQSLTKMKGDMVKQGVTPLLASRIILDAMKEAGAMQSSFFNRDNQLLMTNEIEAKIPQAISNAVKYGQLQGELANAQVTKMDNDAKYAQLIRDYQGSVAASRNRAQALGQRATLDEGTQKKIDALLAESRKEPEKLVMPKSMLSDELTKLQSMLPDVEAKSKQLQEAASKQSAPATSSSAYPFFPWN